MLNRVAQWLGGNAEDAGTDDGFDETQIGAAALLVEAARADGEFSDDERAAIGRALTRQFRLTEAETATLLDEAERIQDDAVEISRFTRAVKALPEARRVEILEMLWEVVLADGDLHAYEANLLRRVGGLIYVSDRENGEARQRVKARLG
jgi:uncharacterized tellurite resistance protein B-like protein